PTPPPGDRGDRGDLWGGDQGGGGGDAGGDPGILRPSGPSRPGGALFPDEEGQSREDASDDRPLQRTFGNRYHLRRGSGPGHRLGGTAASGRGPGGAGACGHHP
ncbi:MAG TPA: hypothetical protein ENF15_02655, partial [Candidatus Acetothermia bacterium]|nr:hypothetical protein [Candidatus Acetothermia bacterium]